MKRLSPYALRFVWAFALLGLWACADPSTTTHSPADSPAASQKAVHPANPKDEEKPAANPTEAAKASTGALVARFDGDYAHIEQALRAVAVPTLAFDDIEGYELSQPKLEACEGECCTVRFAAGLTQRRYRFCWQQGKLAQVLYVK